MNKPTPPQVFSFWGGETVRKALEAAQLVIERAHDEDKCSCYDGLVYCRCDTAKAWRLIRLALAGEKYRAK